MPIYVWPLVFHHQSTTHTTVSSSACACNLFHEEEHNLFHEEEHKEDWVHFIHDSSHLSRYIIELSLLLSTSGGFGTTLLQWMQRLDSAVLGMRSNMIASQSAGQPGLSTWKRRPDGGSNMSRPQTTKAASNNTSKLLVFWMQEHQVVRKEVDVFDALAYGAYKKACFPL
jgi:hypothetical protein